MNDPEWLSSDDVDDMLRALRSRLPGEAYDRALRLYYLACCRRIEKLVPLDTLRKGLAAAESHLEEAVEPGEPTPWSALVKEWGWIAEGDLVVIAEFNSVHDQQSLPDPLLLAEFGRVQRWVEMITSVPEPKLRKLLRLPREAELPPPRKLLERAFWFAFLAMSWAIGDARPERAIEEYREFLSPHVLRETIQALEQAEGIDWT